MLGLTQIISLEGYTYRFGVTIHSVDLNEHYLSIPCVNIERDYMVLLTIDLVSNKYWVCDTGKLPREWFGLGIRSFARRDGSSVLAVGREKGYVRLCRGRRCGRWVRVYGYAYIPGRDLFMYSRYCRGTTYVYSIDHGLLWSGRGKPLSTVLMIGVDGLDYGFVVVGGREGSRVIPYLVLIGSSDSIYCSPVRVGRGRIISWGLDYDFLGSYYYVTSMDRVRLHVVVYDVYRGLLREYDRVSIDVGRDCLGPHTSTYILRDLVGGKPYNVYLFHDPYSLCTAIAVGYGGELFLVGVFERFEPEDTIVSRYGELLVSGIYYGMDYERYPAYVYYDIRSGEKRYCREVHTRCPPIEIEETKKGYGILDKIAHYIIHYPSIPYYSIILMYPRIKPHEKPMVSREEVVPVYRGSEVWGYIVSTPNKVSIYRELRE